MLYDERANISIQLLTLWIDIWIKSIIVCARVCVCVCMCMRAHACICMHVGLCTCVCDNTLGSGRV